MTKLDYASVLIICIFPLAAEDDSKNEGGSGGGQGGSGGGGGGGGSVSISEQILLIMERLLVEATQSVASVEVYCQFASNSGISTNQFIMTHEKETLFLDFFYF